MKKIITFYISKVDSQYCIMKRSEIQLKEKVEKCLTIPRMNLMITMNCEKNIVNVVDLNCSKLVHSKQFENQIFQIKSYQQNNFLFV